MTDGKESKEGKQSRLDRSLTNLIQANKEGSYATHINRLDRLSQAMRTLNKELGYRQLKNVRDLKGRHVTKLVNHWKEKGLSSGTIKNRMADLRWLSRKIENPRIIHRDNKSYGIEDRKYVDNHKNIAKSLDRSDLSRVSNPYIKMSLRLQEAFGLRREEAIKIQVNKADKGDKLKLEASWTKGGREREIPVRTSEQRELLNEVKQFCKENDCKSLIPTELSYRQQLNAYEYQTASVGLNKNHGLRHQYAQDRYHELTGRECPKNGGKTSRQLTPDERLADNLARLEISEELGHSREAITAVYLGR